MSAQPATGRRNPLTKPVCPTCGKPVRSNVLCPTCAIARKK